ncbi:hypothetical protein [Ancylomarina euxina]|nr:hypothetical protein [Ancylomarina euxinus]MUP16829.1 hypothetical protein [Ancylomarina euxinus]
MEIFNSTKKRKSIPKSWCGQWTDKNGKHLIIRSTLHDFYSVTILDKKGNPYEIKLLGDEKKETKKLTGKFTKDTNGNPILQVEAGSNEIGPTYDLYFLTTMGEDKLKLSRNADALEKIIIKPNVGMGLYDDWEDDLGVPWAFPLDDFKKEVD